MIVCWLWLDLTHSIITACI